MTDQQIIESLIARDSIVTEDFFFVRCKPLFYNVIQMVFDQKVEYDELINELYLYLMADDARKLRSFEFRSSVYQWLKVIAIRFFHRLRDGDIVIENESHEPLINNESYSDSFIDYAQTDLERLLNDMPNKRYAFIIKQLIVKDVNPDDLAQEMGISTANLYNIKTRAIRQLTSVALKDIEYYGK